jgi:5'-3' exonuclease
LALVGDSADGFPGLPGWGAKSAAAVLTRYGHVDDVPDDAADWDVSVRGAQRLAATLAEQRAAARLFLTLATLRTDGNVGTPDDWQWKGPTADLAPWAERLGRPSLTERASRLAAARS